MELHPRDPDTARVLAIDAPTVAPDLTRRPAGSRRERTRIIERESK